jgi:Predicted aminopeptidases
LKYVEYLASDSLKGRLAGSGYDYITAKYLEKNLYDLGFEPLFGNSGIIPFCMPSKMVNGMRRFLGVGEAITDTTYNVAMIYRSHKNVNNNILIGAHYDHLGVSIRDVKISKAKKGDIYNGALDNACGVASVLESIRTQVNNPKKLKRNLIVAFFGAEEMGLFGSHELAKMLKDSSININFMLNAEMTGGKIKGDSINIVGSESFDFYYYLKRIKNPMKFKFFKSYALEKGSDHVPFYKTNVPVMSVATSDFSNYHSPADNIDSINFDNLYYVTNFINEWLKMLLTIKDVPKFQ